MKYLDIVTSTDKKVRTFYYFFKVGLFFFFSPYTFQVDYLLDGKKGYEPGLMFNKI